MEPGEYGQKYKGYLNVSLRNFEFILFRFYTKTAEIVAITVIDLEVNIFVYISYRMLMRY